jgi:hypothetical protein
MGWPEKYPRPGSLCTGQQQQRQVYTEHLDEIKSASLAAVPGTPLLILRAAAHAAASDPLRPVACFDVETDGRDRGEKDGARACSL